jgi:hypothetical protein
MIHAEKIHFEMSRGMMGLISPDQDGNGDYEGNPEISVCERGKAGGGLEIIKTLRRISIAGGTSISNLQ